MELTGSSIIAAQIQQCTDQAFVTFSPASGEQLQPEFSEATTVQVNSAVQAAERDFNKYRQLPLARRADFLAAIAGQLREIEPQLVARANMETALPQARLEGELTRTVNQLKLFADFVRDGAFLQTLVDPVLPERKPMARSDIRMTQVPLGPVAVFGASNFPFAFSVAGGDTVSALAAGCPVIVKGHPAHPGTCELAGRAIVQAAEKCKLPKGVFSLLQGSRHELGAELVRHPLLQAVAFTGSQVGGRALFDLAAARPQPIPVFAEMGSINPIFLLPQALATGGEQLARDYADSVALGAGQFCTKPGVLFALSSPELESFIAEVERFQLLTDREVMLHSGIKQNYRIALSELAQRPGVELLRGMPSSAIKDCTVVPAILRTTADRFLTDPKIAEEVFGPAAIIVVCYSLLQMQQCAAALNGQLTATVHATSDEEGVCRELFAILERKAGRLILNGFPTGVEVCHAMVHGGPYPATTDSRSTSVGTEAIRRFLRPISLQNFSPALLPSEFQPS